MLKRTMLLSTFIAIPLLAFAMLFNGCGGRKSGGLSNANLQTSTTGSVSGYLYTRISGRSAEATASGYLPLVAATVTCGGVSGATNSEGAYTLSNVPAGQYTCTITKTGYGDQTFTVTVVAGQTTVAQAEGQTSLVLTPTASGGLVVNFVSPTSVDTFTLDGAVPASITGASLSYTTVAAGSHTITAGKSGYLDYATTTTVTAGATTTVNITLTADSVTAITLVPTASTISSSGGTTAITASCTYLVSASTTCPSSMTWTSSNTSVATVNATGASGTATAVANGSTNITAQVGTVMSNATAITVSIAAAEPSCSGVTGFCVDIVGASASAGGTVDLVISMANPPAAGLGAGVITVTWDSTKLTYSSRTLGSNVTSQAETTATAGQYKLSFTTASAMTSGQTLATLTLSAAQGATGQLAVQWDQAQANTNFTDYNLNLVTQTGITFKDAYVTIQ
jgi:hypothetical protein